MFFEYAWKSGDAMRARGWKIVGNARGRASKTKCRKG